MERSLFDGFELRTIRGSASEPDRLVRVLLAGKVMEEAAKFRRLRTGRERLEAVNHQDPRTALLDQRSHLLEDTGEAALVES